MSKNKIPKTVFASDNSSIISVAESLLTDAGIKYAISNNGLTEIEVIGEENILKARNMLLDLEELDFHDDK
jgi:hypothetical protein